MKLKFFISVIFIFQLTKLSAQPKPIPAKLERPKLIVGIVVDQMRYDYLYRYWNKYSETGFKRLLNDGYSFRNANYNYVPTYTAPGHACIYTGTTPSVNGIISNDWWDRDLKKLMYCVSDTTTMPVGTTSISGKMSPKNLLTTTITDQLRMATNYKSKVVGVALKDRGAILPAGHSANAAYWHDPYSGNWISSTYYMNELPVWAQAYNTLNRDVDLVSNGWKTLLPIEQYTESTADDQVYEGKFKGISKPVFPYNFDSTRIVDKELIRKTPFGNTYTKEFALEALKGEQLGRGQETDFLCISFSSPDYIGHMFGINSIEIEDCYLRLDKDISDLIDHLNSNYGKENVLIFLTADHGAANAVDFSEDHHLPAGTYDKKITDTLNYYLKGIFNVDKLVSNESSQEIYFDHEKMAANKIAQADIEKATIQYLSQFESIAQIVTASELQKSVARTGVMEFIQNGFNVYRSADITMTLLPGWMDWGPTGTTHGAAYSYDTHVPVIFYGWKVKQGTSAEAIHVTDIAPTIADMLRIEFPSGNSGVVLDGILK